MAKKDQVKEAETIKYNTSDVNIGSPAETAKLIRETSRSLFDDIEDGEVDQVYARKLLSLRGHSSG